MRALARVRTSVTESDDAWQWFRIECWAELFDHTIVGWATDIGVSGELDPFATPEFGTWLNNRADEFDGIIAVNLDRFTTDVKYLIGLRTWCEDQGKVLASVDEAARNIP